MSYRLKKNVQSFTVVEGPLADRSYRHGQIYEEIPQNEAARFDRLATADPAPEKEKSVRKTVVHDTRKEDAQ